MSSFYDVVAGNPTMAADVNQYADRLNGSTAAQVQLLAGSTLYVLQGVLQGVPASDQASLQTVVSGDVYPRIADYVRSADGYGGIAGGAGSSITAHFYAQSTGWYTPEALTANNGLYDKGVRVAVQGAHSAGQPIVGYGSGAPASLGANEVYFQLT